MLYIYMYIQFQNDTIDMKVFSGDVSKMLLICTFYFYKDLQLKYKQII